MPVLSRELQLVDVGARTLDAYAELAGAEQIEQIRTLAAPLRGRRVLYVNASSMAGGVAELQRSMVPLLRDAGLDAAWAVMFGEPDFHEVGRQLHDSLQGGEWAVSDALWGRYLDLVEENAGPLAGGGWDTVVLSDPQTLPLVGAVDPTGADWIWRCHLDISEPDPSAWELLRPLANRCDARVFSMPQFVPEGIEAAGLYVIPPAIDPLSPKNVELPWHVCGALLRWIGLDLARPMVCQMLRFDPWKDPLGVIEAWRLAREEVPDLQLALVGSLAVEDPEGWRVHKEITDFAEGEADLHVFTDYAGVGRVEVNAFQRLARCQIQGSIREGFGLACSEALFKATPVLGAPAGGLPAQVRDGQDGFHVSSSAECASRIVELVRDPGLALELGRSGREHVRSRFLVTRLLADELALLAAPR